MPNPNANITVRRGAFDEGVVIDFISGVQQTLAGVTTVVSLTNPTSATNMMTAAIGSSAYPTGSNGYAPLNTVGKGIEFFAAGTYSVAASSTLVFTITFAGATVATFTTASQTNTATTLNWNLAMTGITITTGAAGTMEWHGELNFDSGSALSAAASTFLDSNTSAITAMTLNIPNTLAIQANLGSGNASSVIAQRLLTVGLLN